MQRSEQQDVAQIPASGGDSPQLRLDWDDLKLFLAVAEAGSFRSAASDLGLQASSVMRRIDQLEHRLRVKLFERAQGGVRLTAEGLTILDDARELKDRFLSIERKVAWKQRHDEGVVSIAVTDGLGAFWIAPKLIEFHQIAPRIKIYLKCSMDVPEVLRSSADLALQFTRPTGPDIAFARIARLHIWPYASTAYLKTYGTPRSIDELRQHRYVIQAANQLDESMFLSVLGAREFSDINAVRTNTSTAHYFMVCAGYGIGCLPTYIGSSNPSLVALDIGPDYPIDVYLSYRQAIGDIARVRRTIDWLKQIFDPKRHPLFGDRFVLPESPSTPDRFRSDYHFLPLPPMAPALRHRGSGDGPAG